MTATIALVREQLTDAQVIRDSMVEPQAFAAIFDRHFEAIHAYLRARLGGSLADDLSAEAFTKAFDARRRYDHAYEDARPWLYAIANNLTRQHHRAEQRRLRALARLDPEVVRAPDEYAIAGRLDAAAGGAELAAALDRLRPDDRDALLLVAWAELTYEEAARAAGVPVGTIRSRVHRARSVLQQSLPMFNQENNHG